MTIPSITLTVKLFAALREQAGWASRTLRLTTAAGPARPMELWQQLQLGPLPGAVRVAVNQHFAAFDHPLQEGDEVAFLPPISGG